MPEFPAKYARQHPEIGAFGNLANQCHEAGPLNAKTARLVKLGIALGAGLERSVHVPVRNALTGGITRAELHHVVLLGLTTVGFPASMALLTWVNDLLGRKRQGHKRG